MKKLLDWIARYLGYYTSADVAACVETAEDEATKGRSQALSTAEARGSSDHPSVDSIAIPANYIRYFVSYNYTTGHGGGGFGCTEIGRSQTIRSQEDIVMIVGLITDTLKRRGFQNPGVVILNWQPFQPPRADNGGCETDEDGMPSTVVLRLVA